MFQPLPFPPGVSGNCISPSLGVTVERKKQDFDMIETEPKAFFATWYHHRLKIVSLDGCWSTFRGTINEIIFSFHQRICAESLLCHRHEVGTETIIGDPKKDWCPRDILLKGSHLTKEVHG